LTSCDAYFRQSATAGTFEPLEEPPSQIATTGTFKPLGFAERPGFAEFLNTVIANNFLETESKAVRHDSLSIRSQLFSGSGKDGMPSLRTFHSRGARSPGDIV
jgi:hypothetical protein